MSNLTTAIQINRDTRYKLNNGQHIPVIGYCCYQLLAEDTADMVYGALKLGYRHIDGGVAGYNNVEEAAKGIARFIQDTADVSRQDIWFTTKIAVSGIGYEEGKQAIEAISNKVKPYIEYVDLVLIPEPTPSKEKRLGAWQALQEFVMHPNNGVLNIKSIGVSNYGVKHLDELLNWDGILVKPVLNQLELHPWLPQVKLRKYLIEHDILAEAYAILPPQGTNLVESELANLEREFKISRSEMLLKWSFLQGFVVLVDSANLDTIKKNLDILPGGDNKHNLGKVDLDERIIQALDKPDSHVAIALDGVDLTRY